MIERYNLKEAYPSQRWSKRKEGQEALLMLNDFISQPEQYDNQSISLCFKKESKAEEMPEHAYIELSFKNGKLMLIK